MNTNTVASTPEQAASAMLSHYAAARSQLAATGLFGKALDNKARKLALELAGLSLPDGATIAWATPADWAEDGYRASVRAAKVAP